MPLKPNRISKGKIIENKDSDVILNMGRDYESIRA